MLEKIDKFIDKYLNWKVLLNLVIADVCFLPYILIISTYDMPILHKIIIVSSIGMAVSHIRMAIEYIKKEESL